MIKLKNFIYQATRSVFVRNVVILATGTAGAQFITMGFSPIVTRLYGPEAFGLLGTFVAVVGVFSSIGAFSYPVAIVLPKDDKDAKVIVRLSIYISLSIATMTALLLVVSGSGLVKVLKAEEVKPFIALVPLIIILTVWLRTNEQWLIRKKQFKLTARVSVLQALIINCAKALIGFFNPLSAVLILLYAFGIALNAFMLSVGRKLSREIKNEGTNHHAAKKSLWTVAKTYYDFPLFRTPQAFVHTASQNLPVIMLAAFFGPATAGFYSLCYKVLSLPTVLISKAVGDVFYPRINEAIYRNENLSKIIFKATFSLAVIGIVPYGLIVALGPWLFEIVFGAEWVAAGEYARWVAFLMFFYFINKPCVVTIPVLRLQKFLLIYEITAALLRFVGLIGGFFVFHSDLMAIVLFSAAGIVMYITLIVYVFMKSTKEVQYRDELEPFS